MGFYFLEAGRKRDTLAYELAGAGKQAIGRQLLHKLDFFCCPFAARERAESGPSASKKAGVDIFFAFLSHGVLPCVRFQLYVHVRVTLPTYKKKPSGGKGPKEEGMLVGRVSSAMYVQGEGIAEKRGFDRSE